jgi:hypothetical protein
MSGKLFIASLTLFAATAAYASPSDMKPGEWTKETRQVGNKVSIDVYHRAPYAITGRMDTTQRARRSSDGGWTHETRQVGNKATIDVYRR